MSSPDIFVSLAYALYVIAPGIRDELWLRATLLANSIAFAIWGLWIDTTPVVVANALFSLMSLRQLHRVWSERRPVHLSDEAESVHSEVFDRMDRRAFARLWDRGEEVINPGSMTTLGMPVNALWVVVEGTAEVALASGERLHRAAPALIGEITALSGSAGATATANVSLDEGRVRCWSRSDLDDLFASSPEVEAQMLRGLSETLAARMIAKERQVNPPAGRAINET